MNNIQYWTEKALLQEKRNHAQGDKLLSNLKQEYKLALKNLQEQLNAWYKKYADERGISVMQAKKKLTAQESYKHKMTIEQFIAKAQTGDTWFDAEMRHQYIKSRVTRLQALQDQVAVQLALLGKSQEVQTLKLLQTICTDSYYHPLYHGAKKIGINANFARFNEDLVNHICQTPWSGKSFDERIWQNNKKLIKEVRSILSQGAIDGAGIKRMSAQLAARMDVDYRRAECLIRTESNFVQNEATARAYQQMGIERYQYLATLDGRTSQICRRLDNEIFNLKEKAIGVNYPPMHPRCRSTTIPYYDDDITKGETRAARDRNGKTEKVDASLSYGDWHKAYVVRPAQVAATGLTVPISSELYQRASEDDWQEILDTLRKLPPEHMAYINANLHGIDHASVSPQAKRTNNSHYDWETQIIYLVDDLDHGELAHELGHLFEYELDVYSDEKYKAILEGSFRRKGNTGIRHSTKLFSKPVWLMPDTGEYLSDYQRVLSDDILRQNKNQPIWRALTEYLSEGYNFFIVAPELLKEKNEALYDYIAKEMLP